MANFEIPTHKTIANLLGMVYGQEVAVSDANSEPASEQYVATYIGDDDKLVATCCCDEAFVVYSGAALSMIPANVANEMIADKEVGEVVLGNFHEIMNICSRLLMSETSPHLRLDKTLAPEAANGVNRGFEQESSITGFEIKIPDYGSGRIVFTVS